MARSKPNARMSPSQRAAMALGCARMTARPVKMPARPVKTRKRKPGEVALREIKRYQSTTELLLKKEPFRRLCREVLKDVTEKAEFSISTGLVVLKSDVER